MQPADSGTYICTVSNEAGTVTDTAELTVEASPETPPVKRQEAVVDEGDRVELNCRATGTSRNIFNKSSNLCVSIPRQLNACMSALNECR